MIIRTSLYDNCIIAFVNCSDRNTATTLLSHRLVSIWQSWCKLGISHHALHMILLHRKSILWAYLLAYSKCAFQLSFFSWITPRYLIFSDDWIDRHLMAIADILRIVPRFENCTTSVLARFHGTQLLLHLISMTLNTRALRYNLAMYS